jgi:glycyl-tRNA synthetase alpha subunit
VSVTERVGLIGRVRRNAVRAAKAYAAQREEMGWPLGNALGEAAS